MANPATRQQLQVTGAIPLPNWSAYAGILPVAILRATKDFFAYHAEFLPLGAGAQNTGFNTQIQADSDFLIIAVMQHVTDTAAPPVLVANPMINVRFFDAGSGRDLTSAAEPLANLCGTAQNPFYWPYPKLIKRSSTFTTFLTNLDTVNARNVRLSFIGFKVFATF